MTETARQGTGEAGETEAHLIAAVWEAELRLLDPQVRRNPAAVDELLAPDFHEIGQSGRHWTREHILQALAAESDDDGAADLSERQAQVLGAGLVLLTYRVSIGQRSSLRSSLWRIGPAGPAMVFHQGTPVHGAGA
ncbi:DUF4440 domain-containing protein [Nesterenkonia sp.]|uniref:nuclear transport factor 2 family protein n=1 Tax=Nesterenkonia sp. TaxID=704201 RepID=UPI0026336124|nr:DUF4440 domain-containing protein [Nesterenkonia sp.]